MRVIFKCKPCTHTWVHDYERNIRGQLSRTWIPAPEDMNQHPFSTPDWDKRCPKCQGMNVKTSEVIGTISGKPCNEQCMAATSHVCDCSCGGANHGKDYL